MRLNTIFLHHLTRLRHFKSQLEQERKETNARKRVQETRKNLTPTPSCITARPLSVFKIRIPLLLRFRAQRVHPLGRIHCPCNPHTHLSTLLQTGAPWMMVQRSQRLESRGHQAAKGLLAAPEDCPRQTL